MGALRIARLMSLRLLAALLAAAGVLVVWILRLLKRAPSPSEIRTGVRDHAMVMPFLGHTAKIVLGTLAYNAFVFLIVEPVLRIWFPPLKPWEHVAGLFGSARTTYDDVAPTVATILWIAGNALVITLLNRRLQVAREVSRVTQPPNDFYAPDHSTHVDSLVGAGARGERGGQ